MGVTAAVTMDTGMFIFCACACADAHIHCCLSIKWVDQGVVYPFDYPVIRPASGTQRCLDNRGSTIVAMDQTTVQKCEGHHVSRKPFIRAGKINHFQGALPLRPQKLR